MSDKKPKVLWHARLDFKQAGRWTPTEVFYLNKPYYPEVILPTKCHVLYESPLEAVVGLYSEIQESIRKQRPMKLSIYVYSVKPVYLNRGSYHSPEMLMDKEIFTNDRDFLSRHLVRQSCTFTREANLEIDYSKFNKDPLKDLHYIDDFGKEKFLMTLRPLTCSLTYGSFARYQAKAVETTVFNIESFPFRRKTILKDHDPKNLVKEKKDASKRVMEST